LRKKYIEEFDAEGMLKKLAKGKPIARCSLEEVKALIIDLECQFDLAKGKGEAAIFERKSIYRDILSARLPHLITKWNEEFGGGKKKWTSEAFTGFIEEATKVEEEELLYRKVRVNQSQARGLTLSVPGAQHSIHLLLDIQMHQQMEGTITFIFDQGLL
jgi:hypothetical protein